MIKKAYKTVYTEMKKRFELKGINSDLLSIEDLPYEEEEDEEEERKEERREEVILFFNLFYWDFFFEF